MKLSNTQLSVPLIKRVLGHLPLHCAITSRIKSKCFCLNHRYEVINRIYSSSPHKSTWQSWWLVCEYELSQFKPQTTWKSHDTRLAVSKICLWLTLTLIFPCRETGCFRMSRYHRQNCSKTLVYSLNLLFEFWLLESKFVSIFFQRWLLCFLFNLNLKFR